MHDIYTELTELKHGKGAGVLITVVEKSGSVPTETGMKLLVYPGGKSAGTVGGGTLERMAIEKACQIFQTQTNDLVQYDLNAIAEKGMRTDMPCGGTVTLFFEYFAPRDHVYIFGAGHIGKALVYHLKPLSYYVTVIDDRQDQLEQIVDADQIIHDQFEKALANLEVVENSYFIIATYQHRYDSVVLKQIYQSGVHPRYIGLVSSRRKREVIFKELRAELRKVNLKICHTPVGLDIGGATPHEIALSILAELQAVRYGKSGGHLRDRV